MLVHKAAVPICSAFFSSVRTPTLAPTCALSHLPFLRQSSWPFGYYSSGGHQEGMLSLTSKHPPRLSHLPVERDSFLMLISHSPGGKMMISHSPGGKKNPQTYSFKITLHPGGLLYYQSSPETPCLFSLPYFQCKQISDGLYLKTMRVFHPPRLCSTPHKWLLFRVEVIQLS